MDNQFVGNGERNVDYVSFCCGVTNDHSVDY